MNSLTEHVPKWFLWDSSSNFSKMNTYFLSSIMRNLMSSPTATSLRKRAAAPLLYSIGVYWEHLSYFSPLLLYESQRSVCLKELSDLLHPHVALLPRHFSLRSITVDNSGICRFQG